MHFTGHADSQDSPSQAGVRASQLRKKSLAAVHMLLQQTENLLMVYHSFRFSTASKLYIAEESDLLEDQACLIFEYWGYIGIMENEIWKQLQYLGRDYKVIMEKKMETLNPKP